MEGNAARVHYTGDLRNQAGVNGVPVAASVENMIEVLGASWRANPASRKEILVDVSLAVPRGTTLVLLGRSGSGKTTLLKLINGMLQPSSGEVRVEGCTTQLSGGQRQRVGVARALAADPPILLMDEPFGALDPVTRVELQREFRALAQRLGKTIVFVTHDLREAILLASNIVLLDKGRVVAGGKPAEFLRLPHPEVQAFAASLELNGAPV